MDAAAVLEAARKLPRHERAEIARALLAEPLGAWPGLSLDDPDLLAKLEGRCADPGSDVDADTFLRELETHP